MNFQQDYNERINPALMTRLLRQAVPTINDIEFKYLEVNPGHCKSILPLNQKSANQHGTHQALLLAMGGDYTGGLALATLIPHEPILGIHEISPKKGMSLWLVKAEMEYLKPSTDDAVIEARLPEELSEAVNRRYHQGQTVLLDVAVTFKNTADVIIASGRFRYYCKKKDSLSRSTSGKRINIMYEHLLKTSAKLIAQLRALEAEKNNPLFIDNYAGKVAGKQGQIIARRFIEILPELQNMVAARTHHLDKKLIEYSSKMRNIVYVNQWICKQQNKICIFSLSYGDPVFFPIKKLRGAALNYGKM